MKLYLMRHGEAGYHAHSDRERVLTEIGRYQTELMSNWLARDVTEFDLVLVSPYLRAQQTWQEVSKHFPEPRKWLVLDELTPSAEPTLAADLTLAYAEQYKADSVLVIAHMPLLGYMVSELVPGIEPPLFATSGVTLIDRHGERGSLSWQHTPHTVS
ncbi:MULTISPECIES: phosphohistidine phosphatase SixA [Shewanella]|uniref:phosphohistidine phosphatase SixA n=1 Tax=Shewanella TaxID=22 RepID=UPI001181FAEB|nr:MULTISPECIES: phosphohistidine phosphatase SixA [Shewanella]QYJ91420.1 phosphohistidine phosphatase SixA [Shewanella halotolerans]QYJ92475.1 phosphohistidine phosphatase SixA [Shewanella spartinae]QYJ96358.1 phosphohistidine phosphatase SixA [Shewanella alkalitolerans]QYK11605.1 phosphohistidine phosphatase SixA [Shewanella rhizosphaerae]TVP15316.1 phosphohistidine phosphatase SixA [Shewanella sp. KCT]